MLYKQLLIGLRQQSLEFPRSRCSYERLMLLILGGTATSIHAAPADGTKLWAPGGKESGVLLPRGAALTKTRGEGLRTQAA